MLGTEGFASLQISGCVTILSKTVCKERRLAFGSGDTVFVREENLDREASGCCWIIMPSTIETLKWK